MSDKKCRMCGADAKFVWNGGYYCRVCLRAALEVWEQNMPHISMDITRSNRNDLTGSAWSDILCLQLPTGVAL